MRISTACSSANSRVRLLAVTLALLLPAAALFSLCVGASGVSLTQGLADLLRGVSSPAARILRYIRLPRVLAAMLAGAALAASGVLIQGVLGNPLAGPNVIGVNAGAGFFTLLCACLLPSAAGLLPAAAFAGFLCSLLPRNGGFALAIVLSSVTTVGFCIQLVYHYIFKVHLTMYSFSVGVGQAMGFMDAALQAIFANLLQILLLFLPLILLCVFGRRLLTFERAGWIRSGILLAVSVLLHLGLLLSIHLGDHSMYGPYDLYYKTANVDLSMEKLGFLTTTRLDFQRLLFGFSDDGLELELGSVPAAPEPTPGPDAEPAPDPSGASESPESAAFSLHC